LSPALGFVHTGKALSFVYDIADLYKCAILVPLAFRIAADRPPKLDSVVRRACRDGFRRTKLIERVVPDMQYVLGMRKSEVRLIDVANAENDNRDEPELALWSDDASPVAAGRNYAYAYTPPEHPHPDDEEATG
jgi:CRISPR/Cas system-associated endonuclease Cas1